MGNTDRLIQRCDECFLIRLLLAFRQRLLADAEQGADALLQGLRISRQTDRVQFALSRLILCAGFINRLRIGAGFVNSPLPLDLPLQ